MLLTVQRQLRLAQIKLFGFSYQSDPAPFLTITRATPPCWRITEVLYFDANKGHGNQSANIYVRGDNADGTPALGLTIRQSWPGDGDSWAEKALTVRTHEEIPGDPQIVGRQFAGCDFFMSKDGRRPSQNAPGPYSIQAMGQFPSDVASGFGLDPNWAHASFRVQFRFVSTDPQPPEGDYVTVAMLKDALAAERETNVQAMFERLLKAIEHEPGP